MEKYFNLEVDTGNGGYNYEDNLDKLLLDVEDEYGEDVKNEVEKWALNSKPEDQFIKYGMIITNLGEHLKFYLEINNAI